MYKINDPPARGVHHISRRRPNIFFYFVLLREIQTRNSFNNFLTQFTATTLSRIKRILDEARAPTVQYF
jgi:hypothetical protein